MCLDKIFTVVSKMIVSVLGNPMEISYRVTIIKKSVYESKIIFIIIQNWYVKMYANVYPFI